MSHDKCWCGGGVVRASFNEAGPVLCLESEFHDPEATGRKIKCSKLYVAGPMSGYPGNNYDAFHLAARTLRGVGYQVVSPAEFGADSLGSRVHYVDLIREDLRVLLDCHGVVTLDMWWESAGARNEVQVAGMLKMPVRPINEWLERAYSELN